jgi:hypothetical protein
MNKEKKKEERGTIIPKKAKIVHAYFSFFPEILFWE